MSTALVKDIMNEFIITCQEDESLGEVAGILSSAEVSALLVVDSAGLARGVISQLDLIAYYDRDLAAQKAGNVMTREIISISQDARIQEAATLMVTQNIHRLFVFDETQKPIGVLSVTDIVRAMCDAYRGEE